LLPVPTVWSWNEEVPITAVAKVPLFEGGEPKLLPRIVSNSPHVRFG
jgi:hypothetical protein